MKKKIVIAAVVFLAILVCMLTAFINFLNQIEEDSLTIITDTSVYKGRESFLEEEYAEYRSLLLTFPENTMDSMNIEKFYYERDLASLDIGYKILLTYTLDEDDFEEEKQRLEDISITYEGETRNILYTEEGFHYPAYVAVFSMGTYEYALIDEENHRIICVFTQISGLDKDVLTEEYMPIAEELPQECKDNFDMYYFKMGEAYGVGIYDIPEVDKASKNQK